MAGAEWRARLATFQWERGLRAAIAVGSSMVVCHLLGRPPAAAALGGFNVLLVDNGGPYRTRLVTMATALLGGAVTLMMGSLVLADWFIAVPVTMAVCFAIIFARVLSQPLASTGVLILVLYFAGLGGTQHTLAEAASSAELLLLGGAWAMILSLLLWPVDPFRPARIAVAACFGSLGDFSKALTDQAETPTFVWQRQQRIRMEEAGAALASTSARAPSRTIRARNLTVLLETADLLLARTIRLSELTGVAQRTEDPSAQASLLSVTEWLGRAERAIYEGLVERPADAGAAFGPEGSQRLQWIARRRDEMGKAEPVRTESLAALIAAEEREALLELETAFDAVAAIWTGLDMRRTLPAGGTHQAAAGWDWGWIDSGWLEALQANWTMQSAMLRHALRVAIVGGVDVVAMRLIHINHGFWLPMTSIILLQPYSAGTARKSMQRVTGTIAGGVLAAVLAVAIRDPRWMTPVLTVLAGLTVATFAVDYAIYSFFLTPTFVLLSLPHPHDWRYAGIRMATTLAGAAIAIAAMRLLWPERAEAELGGLLRRGAAADAAYLRAMLRFWDASTAGRQRAEREILAPARRACGMASNDAEEAVDRVMQEPQFGRLAAPELRLRNEALTFATYLRRITQSVTTLAVVGRNTPLTQARLGRLAERIERLSAGEGAAVGAKAPERPALVNVAEDQMLRIERQVGILERAGMSLRE